MESEEQIAGRYRESSFAGLEKSRLSVVDLFLLESNAIEDVWDEQSLLDSRKAWDYLISFDYLTKENILKCHDILMERHLPGIERGCFRKVRVWVGTHEGVKPSKINEEFYSWLNVANAAYFKDKELHVSFEKIHPFIDGNGRTGRIVMNWMRVKTGRDVLVVFNNEKRKYYQWFQ